MAIKLLCCRKELGKLDPGFGPVRILSGNFPLTPGPRSRNDERDDRATQGYGGCQNWPILAYGSPTWHYEWAEVLRKASTDRATTRPPVPTPSASSPSSETSFPDEGVDVTARRRSSYALTFSSNAAASTLGQLISALMLATHLSIE